MSAPRSKSAPVLPVRINNEEEGIFPQAVSPQELPELQIAITRYPANGSCVRRSGCITSLILLLGILSMTGDAIRRFIVCGDDANCHQLKFVELAVGIPTSLILLCCAVATACSTISETKDEPYRVTFASSKSTLYQPKPVDRKPEEKNTEKARILDPAGLKPTYGTVTQIP